MSTETSSPEPMRIGVKDAIRRATNFVAEMYREDPSFVGNLRLEEVELSSHERTWLVTVGFDVRQPPRTDSGVAAALAALDGMRSERLYKRIEVDATSGDVVKMTIRKV